MKKSTIHFEIELDNDHIPEKISWRASDHPDGDLLRESKSVSIALWDHKNKHTMRMDLWSKDMPIDEMKRFYIECLAGIGESLLRSTNDETMSKEIENLCQKLAKGLIETKK